MHVGGGSVGVSGSGSGVQHRPQWFGDRPQKGGPDHGDYSGEQGGHQGGKKPRPDHDEDSSEEGEYEGGRKPRPPRPETNESR